MAGENEPTLSAWWRRARSRLPTSPMPKHWDARGVLAGVIVLVLGAALASILIQRSGDDPEGEAPATKAAAPVEKAAKGLSPEQEVDAVVVSGFESSASGAPPAGGSRR